MQTDALRTQLADALLNSVADAIVAADAGGTVRFWNPGAERLFGFTEAEALGRSLDIIIPERLRARHWEGYRTVMRTGRSRYGAGEVLAVPGLRKDGAQISLEFTLVALRDDEGRITGLVAVLRDVTARFEELKTLRRRLREAAPAAPSQP
ncbi:MAG TPA: PAS domain S-box protein [Xanthobacteraceae bacterium]|nr:PAS domain S-box protein [Xanthobacteraceae bacterium]